MMMRPGDILGRIFYVVTEINHRNLSTEHTEDTDHRDLSTEHTEGTDRRKLSTELFWKLLRKKSLGEIFFLTFMGKVEAKYRPNRQDSLKNNNHYSLT